MIQMLPLFFALTLNAPDPEAKAFLGVQLTEVPEAVAEHFELTGGAMVNEVLAGSPAEKAGLKRRDIVTTIDGKKSRRPRADARHHPPAQAGRDPIPGALSRRQDREDQRPAC